MNRGSNGVDGERSIEAVLRVSPGRSFLAAVLGGVAALVAVILTGLLTNPGEWVDWAALLEGIGFVLMYAALIVFAPAVITIWIAGSSTVWLLRRSGLSWGRVPALCAITGAICGMILAPMSWRLAMSLWDPTLILAGSLAGLVGGFVFGEVARRGAHDLAAEGRSE